MGQTVSGYLALLDTPTHRPSQLSPVSVVTDMFVRPCPALLCFLGPGVAPLKAPSPFHPISRCSVKVEGGVCYLFCCCLLLLFLGGSLFVFCWLWGGCLSVCVGRGGLFLFVCLFCFVFGVFMVWLWFCFWFWGFFVCLFVCFVLGLLFFCFVFVCLFFVVVVVCFFWGGGGFCLSFRFWLYVVFPQLGLPYSFPLL